MIVQYGSYTSVVNECTVNTVGTILRNPRGEPYAVEQVIDVSGQVQGDTQNKLNQEIQKVLDAYSSDGGDFKLTYNDGTVTPDVQIFNDQTIGGVMVVKVPGINQVNQGEYTSYWDYTVQLKAQVLLENATSNRTVWSFEESISVVGTGGPKRVWQDLKRQKARRHQTRPYTRVTATQSGTLVGLNDWLPSVLPGPRWPAFEHQDQRVFNPKTPKWINGSLREFTLSYTYQFENNGPFPGSPYPSVNI